MRIGNKRERKYEERGKSHDLGKLIFGVVAVFVAVVLTYLYIDMNNTAEAIVIKAEDIGIGEMNSKSDFYSTYMDVSIATGEAQSYAQTDSDIPVSIDGTGADSGIILNNYLKLYTGPTLSSGQARVVNVGKVLDAANVSRYTWSMGEGFPTSSQEFANKMAFVENGGHLTRANCDSATQMVGNRYLVAVGPGVMVQSYKSTAVKAGDMKYGTSIDVVVKDGAGTEYYIPCVVADAKVHTYGNGIYQTGVSIDASGKLNDQSAKHADNSVVEFCTYTSNVTGAEVSAFAIDRIIVYEGMYN